MENKQKNKPRIKKEFGLSSLSINNRKTVFLITILIALAGISAYISMPKENFPELVIPQIYIGVVYPGNSPEVIEDKITQPIEKEVNTIKNVDKITSTSVHGYATIFIEFDFKVTPEEALRKVKDAVDKVRGDKDFPQDLPTEPNIFEMNFGEFPIMNINLSGNYPVDELNKYGELLEDKLEALSEISKVEIRGVQEKEIKIAVDKHKMEAKQISFQDVENAIMQENISMSGGEVLIDGLKKTIQIKGEFESAEELENIIVKRDNFNIVYLKDIAKVTFGEKDKSSYAREFRNSVVMLDVVKRSGSNLLDASDKIKDILEESRALSEIPEDVIITITNDQSHKTRTDVSNLENSIILGVLLVVIVLLFFLGLRNALFVGVAIPLSMFMAFMILNAMGVTLNTMVLFSLVLALGMLVDNGIVVVENIYRLMDEGYDSFEAARLGVGEVALPIIASTATTLAAFIPLALWPGIMGEFMQYLPITLIIVLGSSLFVALVINPVLTAVYMKVGPSTTSKKKNLLIIAIIGALGLIFVLAGKTILGNLLIITAFLGVVNLIFFTPMTNYFQNTILPALEDTYSKFLAFAVGKKPRTFLFGTFGLLIFSIFLIGAFTPKVEFFPVNQPNYVNIFIQHPIGTDIEITNKTTKKVEEILTNKLSKYDSVKFVKEFLLEEGGELQYDTISLIKSIIAQVGEGTSDPMEGPSMGNTPHRARITISFAEFEYRNGVLTNDVMEEIRNSLKGVFTSDIQITVAKNQAGPPMQPPINIEVKGTETLDYKQLIVEAEKLRIFLREKGVDGVDELKLDVESGKPELPIEIDRKKARMFNLSTAVIASTIRTAVFGKDIATYKKGDDSYDITLRFEDKYRYNLDALLDQKITFRDQNNGQIRQVPIRSVVKTPKDATTYSAVKRKDLDRLVTIFSNVREGFNPNEVVAEMKSYLKEYELPIGISAKFTGQQEDQEKEMAFLSEALLLAVFMIFLIIVTQFNSFSSPVVIITAVVLSLIGVFLGLLLFQMDFIIIMTMIGIISLAGVVVNNAIVLIDYTNLIVLRKKEEQGLGEKQWLPISHFRDAIVEGGKARLRPVLLTAITTVLGLIPLAVGLNINFISLIERYNPEFYIGGDNVMFFGPMSWTIIFGLTFATFLTLIIVPVMYLLLTKLKYRVYKAKIA